jgi:phage head maturation protease
METPVHPETRTLVIDPAQFPKLVAVGGFALVWDRPHQAVDAQGKTFDEVFRRGCFRETVAHSDVVVKVESREVIARKAEGRLWLRETPLGLEYEITVDERYEAAVRAAGGVRVTFAVEHAGGAAGDRWTDEGAKRLREILRARLSEIVLLPPTSAVAEKSKPRKQTNGKKKQQQK